MREMGARFEMRLKTSNEQLIKQSQKLEEMLKAVKELHVGRIDQSCFFKVQDLFLIKCLNNFCHFDPQAPSITRMYFKAWNHDWPVDPFQPVHGYPLCWRTASCQRTPLKLLGR